MEPTLSALGERLRERTAPLAPTDADHGWVHALLCDAIMLMLEQVGEVYDPPDPLPPLAPLLDPATCPDWALPWLAQLTGAHLPASATPDQARALITSAAGWKRGTPASLRAALEPWLTGTRTVYFRERDQGDPYRLEVVTLTSETTDVAAAQAALTAATPAGLILSYRTVASWDYEQMTTEGGTYAVLKTHYVNYTALREHRST